MWQRWNQTTHIFEKSIDDGASWLPLPLDGSIISEGSIADARLSSNIPLKDGANVFTANQKISKARPELQLLHSGSQLGRVFGRDASTIELAQNLSYNGTNFNLDDTSVGGGIVELTASQLQFLTASAGANPRSLTTRFKVDNSGIIYERGRSNGVGSWVDGTFSSGDYITSDTTTWTVASGNVTTYGYSQEGDMVYMAMEIASTTLGAGTPSQLKIKIPGGLTIASASGKWNGVRCLCELVVNGTIEVGFLYARPGTQYIEAFRLSSNWVAGNTGVLGAIRFKV